MYMTALEYEVSKTPVYVDALYSNGGDFKLGFTTWKKWESMPCGRTEVWQTWGTWLRRVPEMVLNVLFCLYSKVKVLL